LLVPAVWLLGVTTSIKTRS